MQKWLDDNNLLIYSTHNEGKMFSIKFSKANINFFSSLRYNGDLHYNGDNSYLFVNEK